MAAEPHKPLGTLFQKWVREKIVDPANEAAVSSREATAVAQRAVVAATEVVRTASAAVNALAAAAVAAAADAAAAAASAEPAAPRIADDVGGDVVALRAQLFAEREAAAAKDKAVAAEREAAAAKDKAVAAEREAVAAEREAVAAKDKAVAAEREAVAAQSEAVLLQSKLGHLNTAAASATGVRVYTLSPAPELPWRDVFNEICPGVPMAFALALPYESLSDAACRWSSDFANYSRLLASDAVLVGSEQEWCLRTPPSAATMPAYQSRTPADFDETASGQSGGQPRGSFSNARLTSAHNFAVFTYDLTADRKLAQESAIDLLPLTALLEAVRHLCRVMCSVNEFFTQRVFSYWLCNAIGVASAWLGENYGDQYTYCLISYDSRMLTATPPLLKPQKAARLPLRGQTDLRLCVANTVGEVMSVLAIEMKGFQSLTSKQMGPKTQAVFQAAGLAYAHCIERRDDLQHITAANSDPSTTDGESVIGGSSVGESVAGESSGGGPVEFLSDNDQDESVACAGPASDPVATVRRSVRLEKRGSEQQTFDMTESTPVVLCDLSRLNVIAVDTRDDQWKIAMSPRVERANDMTETVIGLILSGTVRAIAKLHADALSVPVGDDASQVALELARTRMVYSATKAGSERTPRVLASASGSTRAASGPVGPGCTAAKYLSWQRSLQQSEPSVASTYASDVRPALRDVTNNNAVERQVNLCSVRRGEPSEPSVTGKHASKPRPALRDVTNN